MAGFKECGSLSVARTESRVTAYKRMMSSLRALDRHAEFVSPERMSEIVPWMKTDDLLGGVYVPKDAAVSPTDLANAFAKKAKEQGVRVFEKCEVERVITNGRRVTGVQTNNGTIDCRYFVNAAGMWSMDLGNKSKPEVNVAAHACEHFYIVTKPLEGVDLMAPCVRDYDGYVYFREWSGGLLAGGFEPRAKPCFREGTPRHFEFQLLQEDWDQFQILWDEIAHRVPMMVDAEIRALINGPESFTPDSGYILGPAPDIENYYVACGMSSIGIVSSAGVGRAVAEWITDGRPSLDFTDFDNRRFGKAHVSPAFLANRASEILAVYGAAIPSSEVEFKEGRNLLLSPLHEHLQKEGAFFSPSMGWERVSHFKIKPGQGQPEVKDAFARQAWLGDVEREVEACTSGVGLFDASSTLVLNVESADSSAIEFLQNLCCSEVNIQNNETMETVMLNDHGGVEALCYVTRNSDNQFTLFATPDQETRLLGWIHGHLPPDGAVRVEDRTGQNTILQLIGPKSHPLVLEMSDQGRTVMKLPHTYDNYFVMIQELKDSVSVFDWLRSRPEVTLIGYYATRYHAACHAEPNWGTDVTPHIPATAWRPWTTGRSKEMSFIGKEILDAPEGSTKSLVQLEVTPSGGEWMWGHEPVYTAGTFAGCTTSAQYDFQTQKLLCWAILNKSVDEAARIEVEVANQRIPATLRITV